MSQQDLPDVMQVERSSYEFPWSEKAFADSLKAGYRCVIANPADAANKQVTPAPTPILGYGILLMAADEAHILNLCCAPAYRHQGVAGTLLDHLLGLARAVNTREVFLEVRASNKAAIQLYETRGFNQIGVRANYYDIAGGREDALAYALSLST